MNNSLFSPFRFILIATTLCLPFESGVRAAQLDQVSGRDVTLSGYNPTNSSLVIHIHVARLFTDYERGGFFRIGILPIPVAEKVQIQIQAAEWLTNALFMLQDWEQPALGVRRVEFRDLQVFLSGESEPRLCAVVARIGKNGVLELSDASVVGLDARKISIPRGTLQVAGKDAGRLFWNNHGRTQELFPLKAQSQTP